MEFLRKEKSTILYYGKHGEDGINYLIDACFDFGVSIIEFVYNDNSRITYTLEGCHLSGGCGIPYSIAYEETIDEETVKTCKHYK